MPLFCHVLHKLLHLSGKLGQLVLTNDEKDSDSFIFIHQIYNTTKHTMLNDASYSLYVWCLVRMCEETHVFLSPIIIIYQNNNGNSIFVVQNLTNSEFGE